jgi:homocysteine S-methyltransferase
MKNRTGFLDELRSDVLIGDGAIAFGLRKRHAVPDGSIERLNLLAPDVVSALHSEYVAAGSRVIETNTYAANRLSLRKCNDEARLHDIITAGVALARSAGRPDTYIGGAIGPLPGVDAEMLPHNDRLACYQEQVIALLDAGVDLLSFKTFSDLTELTAVIRMVRRIGEIPIAAHMTFERDGLAADGTSALKMAEACTDAGADIVGANCGYGARSVMDAISRMSGIGVPTSAYVNAGFPEWVDGSLLYSSSPKYIAELARDLAAGGTRLIGGCCGTSPEFIQAIAQMIGRSGGESYVERCSIGQSAQFRQRSSASNGHNTSSRVIAQLDPPDGPDQTSIVDAALKLRDAGVTRVSISDNCLAEARSDALTTSGIVSRATGLDVTLHLTCRDRNRLAIQSTLIGAQAVGIKSLLCLTGAPISMCQETNTSGVFDLNSIGLVRLVSEYNSRRRGSDRRTSFEIGVAVNPNVRNLDGQVDKLRRKVDAGAMFALTQPLFSAHRAERFRDALDQLGVEIPVYIGLLPLTSTQNAEFVHNEVPGIYVPDEVRESLHRYERVSDQRAVMTELMQQLIEAVYPAFSSFFMIAPRNNVELILPLLSHVFTLIGTEHRQSSITGGYHESD